MRILILGGAGMVGRKLAERLARDGRLGSREISGLTLQDVVAAQKPAGGQFPVDIKVGDISQPGEAALFYKGLLICLEIPSNVIRYRNQ